MLLAKTGRRIPKPRAVQLSTLRGANPMGRRRPLSWGDLEKGLTWSKHIDQVRKKAAQRLGTLGPLLNRRSGLSIRNGVLLYKQLIRPMRVPFGGPPLAPISKTQVLQSKCLRIATSAPWYVGNRQIHDDFGVPYFSDHIRSVTERFDLKLADVGNPILAQIGRHLRCRGPRRIPTSQSQGFSPLRPSRPCCHIRLQRGRRFLAQPVSELVQRGGLVQMCGACE